jgi:uncharacterized protein (TIGR03089 family)
VGPVHTTIAQAFADAVRRDPTAPLLTWYDDATGDRTELSGATLDNWVAKTANLLVDGLGLGLADTAAVLLPPHWQTAAILLGCSTAGLGVDLGGPPHAVDALFTSPDRVASAAAWPAPDRDLTGLLPLARPLAEVPPGFVDFVTEVRNHGDAFRGEPLAPDTPALGGLSHVAVMRAATERAADLGLTAGGRALIDTETYPDPIDWLLAPLAAGASMVLCAHLDPGAVSRRAEVEKAGVVLT